MSYELILPCSDYIRARPHENSENILDISFRDSRATSFSFPFRGFRGGPPSPHPQEFVHGRGILFGVFVGAGYGGVMPMHWSCWRISWAVRLKR